jgi:hypothetical protein
MDLKQGGRSVHDYSKQFNHLAQYAPDQVDTDEKKKDRFMIGLSTKLQECMGLNTGGTFPEFISNVMRWKISKLIVIWVPSIIKTSLPNSLATEAKLI